MVTVHRQVHPIRPPYRVAAGFISSSSHGQPAAGFSPPECSGPPCPPGRSGQDSGAPPLPTTALENSRSGAAESKTDCLKSTKRLQASSSPQHYPIPHFPEIFRRDYPDFRAESVLPLPAICNPYGDAICGRWEGMRESYDVIALSADVAFANLLSNYIDYSYGLLYTFRNITIKEPI